jgi:hypothetical protein
MNVEPRRQVSLDHVPKVLKEPIRGFHDLLRQKPFSLLVLTRTTRCNIPEDAILHLTFDLHVSEEQSNKQQTNSVALSPRANYTD